MNILSGFGWMLTVIIFSSATLGGAFTIENLLNLLERYRHNHNKCLIQLAGYNLLPIIFMNDE